MSDQLVQHDEDDDLFVTVIQPGVILSDEQWSAVISSSCAAYGLEQKDVLTTAYGYAPLPKPPTPNADGTGKVAAGVDVDVAVHPVFWLDAKTRERRPDEPDDLYAVRLYLELLARKVLDPNTQEVFSPFASQGIDDSHEQFESDMWSYLKGEPVSWLTEFTIPMDESYDQDAIVSGAERLVRQHRKNYAKFKEEMQKRSKQALVSACNQIRNADFRKDAKSLLEAGTAYLKNQNQSTQAALQAAVDDVMARIKHLDEVRGTVELAVDRAETGDASLINLRNQLEIQEDKRKMSVSEATNRVVQSPSEQAMAQLWKALQVSHRDIITRGRGLVSKLESIVSAR